MRWLVQGWTHDPDARATQPDCHMYITDVLKLNALVGTMAEAGYQRIRIERQPERPAGS